MRKYERLWNTIRKEREVTISAALSQHSKIIQAVRKEKATDMGFRYLNVENKERYELKEEVVGKTIKFYLLQMAYIPKLEDL